MTFIERSVLFGLVGALAALPTHAWSASKTGRETETSLRERALGYCQFLPAAQNPWGKQCAAEVEKRVGKCVPAGRRDSAAFETCLGLPAPPPIPEKDQARAARLQQVGLEWCPQLPRMVSGEADCATEVRHRLPRCLPAFLAKQMDSAGFGRCLGFRVEIPPAREVLIKCPASRARLRFSFAIGREQPWPGSHPRTLEGRSLHVADEPVVTHYDLLAASLIREGERMSIEVEVTSEAAASIAKATHENKGQSLVTQINGETVVSKIVSAINGNRLLVSLSQASRPSEVCKDAPQ
jgi:hypothetical protein